MLELNKGTTFSRLMFGNRKSEKISKVFQLLFIAIYELIFIDHMRVNSVEQLCNLCRNLGIKHLNNIKDNDWDSDFRKSKVDAIKGVIKDAFKKKKGEDAMTDDWTQEIDNILQLSRVEGAIYDYKIGFHNLKTDKFDKFQVSEYIKILTAQVNKAPFTTGHIIFGIADGKNSKDVFTRKYSINGCIEKIPDSEFYLTGLDAEVGSGAYRGADHYIEVLKGAVDAAPVEESVKREIKQNLKFPKYHGKSLLILSLTSDEDPIPYNGEYYVREGNGTKKIQGIPESVKFAQHFKDRARRIKNREQ